MAVGEPIGVVIDQLLLKQQQSKPSADIAAGSGSGRSVSDPVSVNAQKQALRLPLEVFDDNEYELRQPREWLALGTNEEGIFVGLPARALRDADDESSGTVWEQCRVIG